MLHLLMCFHAFSVTEPHYEAELTDRIIAGKIFSGWQKRNERTKL